MAENLRLTKRESEGLRNKCIEMNKVLIMKEKTPLRDSELAHFILQETIKHVKVNQNGEIIIDN